MIQHVSNSGYTGYFEFINSDGKVTYKIYGTGCSQQIRVQNYTKDDSHVLVYFPEDRMVGLSDNEYFFKYWASIVSGWFAKVTYEGKVDMSESKISKGGFSKPENFKSASHQGSFSGGYVVSSMFHCFRIDIPDQNLAAKRLKTYASYVLIRYLFFLDFQNILTNYFAVLLSRVSFGMANECDFKLLQFCHYIDTGHKLPNSTYSLFPVAGREFKARATNGTGNLVYVYKLSDLKDVIKRMEKTIDEECTLFKCTCPEAQKTNIKCDELDELIYAGKFKEAYDKLK